MWAMGNGLNFIRVLLFITPVQALQIGAVVRSPLAVQIAITGIGPVGLWWRLANHICMVGTTHASSQKRIFFVYAWEYLDYYGRFLIKLHPCVALSNDL